MAVEPGQAVQLARALRDLRENQWPDADLTQAQLAKALSTENRVASATLSSWESLTNPKTPPASRITTYARFFATRRSLSGPAPHLIPESDLTADEHERFREIEAELLGLLNTGTAERRSTFTFEKGPITIICPELPVEQRGQLADPSHPNFNRLQMFADLDALLEMWGHVRMQNPDLWTRIRLPTEVVADDLSAHVILLGGVGWNNVTRRFQAATGQMPITQELNDPKVKTGDSFRVKDAKGERSFLAEWYEPPSGQAELIEDVAHIARLRNPFQSSRTLTICNGIHSRGVLGAVRCLTDASVREPNEKYLSDNFHEGWYALLVRVPVFGDETLTPDLQNPYTRLYEWSPAPPNNGTKA